MLELSSFWTVLFIITFSGIGTFLYKFLGGTHINSSILFLTCLFSVGIFVLSVVLSIIWLILTNIRLVYEVN